MSGRKGLGNNPLAAVETSRKLRRRVARGKGLSSTVSVPMVKMMACWLKKEVKHV